jgi:hypothetical protein
MPAILMDFPSVRFQDLANQQAQFSIAKNCHHRSSRDFHLIENLASGSQRLYENGVLGRNARRHATQITLGQCQEVPERAGMFQYPQYRAIRTMTSKTAPAPLALFARQIDLANHTLANPCCGVRFNNLADKFVTRNSAESVVAAREFQIGIADAAV